MELKQTKCNICNGAATDKVWHLQWSCNRQSVTFAMELQQAECEFAMALVQTECGICNGNCNIKSVAFAMELQQIKWDICHGAVIDRVWHLNAAA